MFNKVTIIGVGLIGGSIGLAAKKKKLAKEIVGVCRHRESLDKAKEIGAIDRGVLNCKEAASNADLVILSAAIAEIIKTAKLIAPYLKRDCLLTDVGSTKVEIVRSLEKEPLGQFGFVGAHPLAGSEKRGVTAAYADLFKGALCILTRTKHTNATALSKIATFWKRLGCRIRVLTPQRHDQIAALVSHLPHLAAAQLVKVARDGLDFAARGFLDTTRIVSSDAEIWSDICLTNKKFINKALREYIERLRMVKGLVNRGDKKRLSLEFKTAKTLRDALQK